MNNNKQKLIDFLNKLGYNLYKEFYNEKLLKLIFISEEIIEKSVIISIVYMVELKYYNIYVSTKNIINKEDLVNLKSDNQEIVINGIVYNSLIKHIYDDEIVTVIINGLNIIDLQEYIKSIFDPTFDVTEDMLPF
jgi:hypothetical protein